MLGKLLKYEIRATGRRFLPLYALLIAFAAISRILNWNGGFFNQLQMSASKDAYRVTAGISLTIYFSMIVAIFVVTIVVMIQRFVRNLLRDEGYLMFTLPVRPWQHILSKLIAVILWAACSLIVTGLSVLILAGTWEMWASFPRAVTELFSILDQAFGSQKYLFVLEILLMLLTQFAATILLIYACISVGHLLPKRRMLGIFGAFLVLNSMSQLLETIPAKLARLGNTNSFIDLMSMASSNHWVIWYGILMNLTVAAAYFIITNYVLLRRLNLE